ncbi:MAG: enoyl-CoA hydratase/isomerase family protein [Chloroflexi bacterium]|nr:enoyl-CoA hydratase/isomerase family protein [Chloroflexota bacterium]
MGDYKYVIYKKEGEVARITLNRPEKLNAIVMLGYGDDYRDLMRALDEAAEDDDVKVVVIKGAGRAFSAGQDLSQVGFVYGFGTGKPGERRPSQRARLRLDRKGFEGLFRILLHPKLTVAQVHGYCLEAGLIIAMFCDVTIAADDAIFGFPGQRLGFSGSGEPDIQFLALTVGLKRMRYMMLTGRRFGAAEAERMGLVQEVVPRAKLEERVNTVVQALTTLPRDGIAVGKAHIHMIYDSLGVTTGLAQGYIMHTLFTNLRFEEGEWNYFKDRREKGARQAFHHKDDLWKAFEEGR